MHSGPALELPRERATLCSVEFRRFLDFVRALEEAKVEYVLIGGVAMNLHGIVRATEDIDFFVRPDAENVQRLKTALRSVWDDPEIEQIQFEDFQSYPTLRYGPPNEDFVIDVLTRLGTKFSYDDLEWERVTLEGVDIRVATPATLVRMKCDTLRPIDQADASALRRMFRLEEN